VKPAVFFVLAAALSTTAGAATITVTITGTTGEIRVGEGPIFGHRSYQLIPAGDPFVLTYTFDEEKGKQTISEVSENLITQSQIENTGASSPGINATLQIGSAVWEFGPATDSQVTLKTSVTGRSEQFVFKTRSGGNHISAQIVPPKAVTGRRTPIGGQVLPPVRSQAAPLHFQPITGASPRKAA
jgi:hypothetical protein